MKRLADILCGVACALGLTSAATAQTFSLDTDYATGTAALGLDMLIDVPVGTPVYIGAYELCHQGDQLFALGFARVDSTDLPIGLIEVTRQDNGTGTAIIPDVPDPYGDAFFDDMGADDDLAFPEDVAEIDPFYEDDRLMTLWTLLQGIPCDEWGALAADPARLLPVVSIDGAISMSQLLDMMAKAD